MARRRCLALLAMAHIRKRSFAEFKICSVARLFFKRHVFYARSRTLEILRFIVAGGIATGTNLGFLYILTRFFGFWYIFQRLSLISSLLLLVSHFKSFGRSPTDLLIESIKNSRGMY